MATVAVIDVLACVPKHASAATYEAAVSQTGTPFSVGVDAYPRLANLYGFKSADQVPTMSRYGLIIAARAAGTSGAVRALKLVNPAIRVAFYDNTTTVDVPGFDGLDIYPGWWLTLVGTQLSAAIDPVSTSIPVANAAVVQRFLTTNPDVLVDGETMHVLSVDIANNRLTVQRGYYSTASAHAPGAHIAAHATKWPHTWMMNVTPYCPVDPATGQTWVEYAAQHARQVLAEAPWDGVLWDDGNVSFAHLFHGQLDANNDNVPDGGDGPSGTGWQEGVQRLLSRTRSLAPGKLQLVTDAYYPGLMDGEEMEHFPFYADGWLNGFNTYLQLAGPDRAAPYTVINADTANGADTARMGAQSLRSMRFNLAATLMGDGYFAYDSGPQNHGQTWWYDEYDDGAGSSLASAVGAAQTTIRLAHGTGSKFQPGEVVHVPDGRSGHEDEQMLITAINRDSLTVRRGYNGTAAAPHPVRTKVATQAQILAGLGWLGRPLGPAISRVLPTPSLLANGDFTARTSAWLSPWSLDVLPPAAASIRQDTHDYVGGGASARIDVMKAAPGNAWFVSVRQQNPRDDSTLRLTAGTTYTLTFWAKSSAGQTIQALVQQSVPPWDVRSHHEYTLTGRWQRYRLTFTAPVTESAIKVFFSLAQSPGTIWLDGVRFKRGDTNLWRRDFTHGTVLLNATNTEQTVTLGPGYHRIAGTQDPVTNNGAAVTTVTIAPQDGILLVRSGTP